MPCSLHARARGNVRGEHGGPPGWAVGDRVKSATRRGLCRGLRVVTRATGGSQSPRCSTGPEWVISRQFHLHKFIGRFGRDRAVSASRRLIPEEASHEVASVCVALAGFRRPARDLRDVLGSNGDDRNGYGAPRYRFDHSAARERACSSSTRDEHTRHDSAAFEHADVGAAHDDATSPGTSSGQHGAASQRRAVR